MPGERRCRPGRLRRAPGSAPGCGDPRGTEPHRDGAPGVPGPRSCRCAASPSVRLLGKPLGAIGVSSCRAELVRRGIRPRFRRGWEVLVPLGQAAEGRLLPGKSRSLPQMSK